ncbi:exodeoxyribonuclease III [bacterium F16]|nr:exodeoxyribonuclease III [bacterium F16]
MKKIVSWNVNGIRACARKGFLEWIADESPDVLAIQEIKVLEEQLDDKLLNVPGYKAYWFSAVRKGYSGVAFYCKEEPNAVENLSIHDFDYEGRTAIAHFDDFSLINCYFPNSQEAGKRLEYKLAFCDAILTTCNRLVEDGRNIILCGDYNIAHTEIDLKNPKTNQENPGFLPEERDWMSQFLSSGYKDTFREQHPGEPGHYSWWSYRFQARDKDIGWRLDYHCVNDAFADAVIDAGIHKSVMGSDHCPVSVTLDI